MAASTVSGARVSRRAMALMAAARWGAGFFGGGHGDRGSRSGEWREGALAAPLSSLGPRSLGSGERSAQHLWPPRSRRVGGGGWIVQQRVAWSGMREREIGPVMGAQRGMGLALGPASEGTWLRRVMRAIWMRAGSVHSAVGSWISGSALCCWRSRGQPGNTGLVNRAALP